MSITQLLVSDSAASSLKIGDRGLDALKTICFDYLISFTIPVHRCHMVLTEITDYVQICPTEKIDKASCNEILVYDYMYVFVYSRSDND